jgi:hypothetical protein
MTTSFNFDIMTNLASALGGAGGLGGLLLLRRKSLDEIVDKRIVMILENCDEQHKSDLQRIEKLESRTRLLESLVIRRAAECSDCEAWKQVVSGFVGKLTSDE